MRVVCVFCACAGLPSRHQAPNLSHLSSLRGAFAGLGVPFEEDEEVVDTPMALGMPDPRAPGPTPPPPVPHASSYAYTTAAGLPLGQQLGINMLALAVPQQPLGQPGGGGAGSGPSVPDSRRTTGSNEGQQQRRGPAGAKGAAAGAAGSASAAGTGDGSGAGGAGRGPEEVVLCFGIIDILQVRAAVLCWC